MEGQDGSQQQGASETPSEIPMSGDTGASSDGSGNKDAEDNKGIAIATYFIFFLPLLVAKDSKFAMYHANQAFLLFLLSLAIQIVGGILMYPVGYALSSLGMLFVLVLLVIGIMNASKGETKPLPVIGELFVIFK